MALRMKKPAREVTESVEHPPQTLAVAARAAGKGKRKVQAATAADADPLPPAGGKESFPIVGVGASAGGLAAFEAFFSGMPVDADPGMAFVLVQHLAPDHKSLLAELIGRHTRMWVIEVADGMVVEPNCAYIIPPNHDMALLNGTLHLFAPVAPRGHRLPIDFFFRSLADSQHELAIGIVLSGTGSDGTLGLRAIKGEGGMVMAQAPETTEFDGMPQSAIATGLMDYVLPPAEMPAQLIAYAARAFGKLNCGFVRPEPEADNSLQRIFILLRSQTGHDFSQYKPSTISRRIDRRMAVHQIDTLHSYVKYLQQSPTEVEALFRDLLIGVTRFFRDPEAFQALEDQVIPKLLADNPADGVIRVWTPGCSTGEEAYSIAILLQERMEALKQNHSVQIFATDIDRQAIIAARSGVYPASIAADLPPERLAHFFAPIADPSAYRIHRGIRDMLVFSEQDVIKDPPFSKLDLISCRNLLIYLGADLQRKLIALFHYALNPRGVLFLGTSEGVGEFGDLFAPLDRKAKLYQRKEDVHALPRLDLGPFRASLRTPKAALPQQGTPKPGQFAKPSLRELTEQALLQQVAPACALVNRFGDILYLRGRTGMFLEPTPGEAGVNNLLKMAREGLLPGLATTLHKAVDAKECVRCPGLRVKANGHFITVDLSVRPVLNEKGVSPEPHLYLVILEEVPTPENTGSSDRHGGPAADAGACIATLRQELQAKDEYLQTTLEQLETSNEELKSSNEEMQSVNEELQSANEELETSKEEMQSVNEELATVNTEMQTKVVELTRANNDMNNLLAGTGIGSVFVDHRLRVLRFTPAASAIINLIASDVGRPVGHLVPNLVGYNSLLADAQEVLDTLVSKEVDVFAQEGRSYRLRIQPYRTLDNVIEGVVLTFVDITELKQTEAALRNAVNGLLRLAVVVRDAHDALTVQDLDGRTLAWNPGAVRMYGWSEIEALQLNASERMPPALRAEEFGVLQKLGRGETLAPHPTKRLTKDGSLVDVWLTATALTDESGRIFAVATTERMAEPA